MSKKVAFVELTVFSGVLPLASGYMEACCRKDPALVEALTFEKISLPVSTTPYETVLEALRKADADVYAFSSYVWNIGMVRRLLAVLLVEKPGAHFILGGPQVINQGHRYLTKEHENVFVCNGEGERTFPNFVRALLSPEKDFSAVRGISFFKGGEMVTTEEEPRITDLSEVPSPFLEGLFEKNKYTWTVIETNRGCPFKCNYCYWGAAIGAKVYKYDNARIEKEMTWIGESGCMYVFIADANWGMLPRDVDLSKHLADTGKKFGAPMAVYFCGSKNTPERVSEITGIFHGAGMLATQSVALQTMSAETLKKVNRDNIKTSAYIDLQRSLNEKGISSLVEIIWPLPGETLPSFKEGLAKLCEMGADSFVFYPLLLMNNVELNDKREEYGLVTMKESDPNSEAEVVIQTNEIGPVEYAEGIRYIYSVSTLHTLRSLWALSRYLHSRGLMGYEALFEGFMQLCKNKPNQPYVKFLEESIKTYEFQKFDAIGAALHINHHAEREAFDTLLFEFCKAQDFWVDATARFYFEVDLLNRPYPYRNSKILPKKYKFERLKSVSVTPEGYMVEINPDDLPLLEEYIKLQGAEPGSTRFEVNHRRTQLPYMPSKSLKEHYSYCQDLSQRMGGLLPIWRVPAKIGKLRMAPAPRV
ncbi:MAG: cobalamin-dependent protein [Byssovorax sp.]